MQIAEAFVAIRPNSKGFKSEVERDVETPLRNVKSMVAGLAVGAAALSFAKGGLDELKEQQAVASKLEATLKATGGAANVTKDELDDMASSLQDLTGKDAEAIQSGQALLLQFRNVRNEVGEGNDIFDRASKAALDLSVATGTDATSAFQTLGRALEDPVQGMRALRAANVILDESQKATLKSLVDSGDQLGAQRFILERLEAQVGGVAAAYGETLPGKLERSKNALEDVQAAVVGAAAPALESVAGVATTAADAFTSLPGPVQTGVLLFGALAVAAKPASTALAGVRTVLSGMGALFDRAAVGAYGFAGQGLKSIALQGAAGAAAVAGLVVAVQEWQRAAAEAEAAQKALMASIGEKVATEGYDQAVDRLGRIQAQVKGIREETANGKGGILDIDYRRDVNALADALDGQALAMRVNLSAAEALARQQGISVEAAYEQVKAAGAAKKSAEEEAVAQQDLADALAAQVRYRKEAEALVASKVSGVSDLRTANVGYETASAAVDTAAARLAAARTPEEQAAAAAELESALFALADARVKVAEAQAKVNGEELSGADAARIYSDQLAVLAGRFPGLRGELEAYIALLDRADDPRVADVQVKFRAAIDDPEGLFAGLRKAFEIEGGAITPEAYLAIAGAAGKVAAAQGAGRAYGGPVTAGVPYTVGERTRETFVPTEDGVIVPGPLGGGFSPTINIYGHDHSSAELAHRVMSDLDLMLTGAQR